VFSNFTQTTGFKCSTCVCWDGVIQLFVRGGILGFENRFISQYKYIFGLRSKVTPLSFCWVKRQPLSLLPSLEVAAQGRPPAGRAVRAQNCVTLPLCVAKSTGQFNRDVSRSSTSSNSSSRRRVSSTHFLPLAPRAWPMSNTSGSTNLDMGRHSITHTHLLPQATI